MEKSRVFEAKDHSESIQDILGKPPSYLTRWGITIIFGVVILLFFISWFIRYPDIIIAPITISNLNPPIRIVAKSSGRISFLNQQKVIKKGDIIGYIENSARYEDIIQLKNILDTLKMDEVNYLPNLVLGELQPSFENMQIAIQEIMFFQSTNPIYQQINTIRSQITSTQKMNENLNSQKLIIKQELDIAEKEFEREKTLYNQKITASQEIKKVESILEKQRMIYKNIEKNILNNELRIEHLRSKIVELKKQIGEKELKFYIKFQNSLQNLKSQYVIWQTKYLLESPLDGKLIYLQHFINQQYVENEQEIAVIIPKSSKNIGKIELPIYNSGKVKKGQKVSIMLYNFPPEEFGILESKIEEVPFILQKSEKGERKYHLTIMLPEHIQTTYKKELPNFVELQGEAHIITEDLRLIERFFYQFVKALKR
ncbi:MAG: HlyD family secretion protein [Raineya sp.]|jgi:hypothetical protein|nr:HlyD family secretion protein [Raineya sp.]